MINDFCSFEDEDAKSKKIIDLLDELKIIAKRYDMIITFKFASTANVLKYLNSLDIIALDQKRQDIFEQLTELEFYKIKKD